MQHCRFNDKCSSFLRHRGREQFPFQGWSPPSGVFSTISGMTLGIHAAQHGNVEINVKIMMRKTPGIVVNYEI